ncbi:MULTISPECIES: S8 family peptidase [unclassified Pseudovibrio]|uniref:S8 family peptidase n=1 Tax=unclassified Pseudovibrio TaxID=2627060 RepID=UPI0007AE740E|nr:MULTISPECIES: S8 family peptidase [unclassified Pseudovibrio]KZL02569.1 Extracellular serine protease precursor [Pseudovibrio sp. W74]KZL07888.1 Extracellular serine protease precursor [Pseudovibrio sp. Ad14]
MRTTLYWAGVLITLLSLSGCNGGGGSSDATDTANRNAPLIKTQTCTNNAGTPDAFSSSCTTSFNTTTVDLISKTDEFATQKINVSSAWTGTGYSIKSNAFSDINLQFARSVGLTGAGETIAILDTGFLLSHKDLRDKNVTVYGKNVVHDHGTFVATIAAGDENGSGVMGVASGADLHLSTLEGGSPSSSGTEHLAATTTDAFNSGAIVQNNSWGYHFANGATITLSYYNSIANQNPGLSPEAVLANYSGQSIQSWKNYRSALNQFTSNGVVVFAQSNDENDTSSSFIAALPEIFSELKGSWAVAVNGLPEYDSDGNISKVHRVSASCLETAQYCLTTNGTVRGGTSSSDSAYGVATGTSFAAPQVSGSITLLAEAFPSLPAKDLLNRLFASANNSFMTTTGTIDFGNGVTHAYNEEFGHGFLDLKAALMPIGNVGAPLSDNAYDGIVPLSEVSVTAGTAHGDAIANALQGKAMAIYDSLGANFAIDASALVGSQSQNVGAQLATFRSDTKVKTSGVLSYSFMINELSQDSGGLQFVSGAISDVGEELGFIRSGSGLFSGDSSIIADGPETMAFATVSKSNGHGIGTLAFVERTNDGIASVGFGLSTARAITPDLTSVFGFTVNSETGTALGLTAESQDDESLSAASSAFSFAGEWTYRQGLSFFANAELGMTVSSGAGYIESLDPALHSAFSAGMKVEGLFSKTDTVTFLLRQPLRIEQGTGTIRVPSGRLLDGTISYADHEIELTPSARQVDFGFRYDIDLMQETSLGLGAVLSVNEGHTTGNLGASGIIAFKHRF